MSNAFQVDAFQNNAFQVYDSTVAELASVAVAANQPKASVTVHAGLATVVVGTLAAESPRAAYAELATVTATAYGANESARTVYAGLATVTVTAFGGSSEGSIATGHLVEYCIELFDGSGAGRGPGSKVAELWDARNLGWSRYDRLPGKAFATLYQTSALLSLLDPLVTHVRITRVGAANVEVYNGQFIDYASQGDDVVLTFYDYLALFGISRCGYRTMYPTKLLGSEIVAAEVGYVVGASGSPLGFVPIGTIQDPFGADGTTPIKTNEQFGTLDQTRLQLLYDLSEMGRANTDHWVTFSIGRTSPFTFSFLRDAGAQTGIGLVLNGTVSDYAYLPDWTHYRNDLASVGLNAAGGTAEIVKTDAGAITTKGLRQDVATIRTLLGVAGAATEADQQQAALARMLYQAVNQKPVLLLRIVPGSLEPFVGWDIADKATVEIINGADSITGPWRMVGIRALFNEYGEDLSLFVGK